MYNIAEVLGLSALMLRDATIKDMSLMTFDEWDALWRLFDIVQSELIDARMRIGGLEDA